MGGVFTKPKAPLPQSSGIPPALVAIANLDPKVKALSSPTTAEISQSSATDADGSSTSVKTKRKGRSATILTSSTGVEGDATLGKKSLLGE
jgi:hypothetical protein